MSGPIFDKVELYNRAYGNGGDELYRQIRLETYGCDFGQTSWVTTAESQQIPKLLRLEKDSQVLEIGSGSGRYALYLAEQIGCHLTGIDINAQGVRSSIELAVARDLQSRVTFRQHDAAETLPFGDAAFDAVYSNDAFCHVKHRALLLRDVRRVLKPGGLLLFSDALVIGGLITSEEIAIRSSIGFYVFTAPGVNEGLLTCSGFRIAEAADTTWSAAEIAKRWHDARAARSACLRATEGTRDYESLQLFLSCVCRLSSEGRLQRWLYLATAEVIANH